MTIAAWLLATLALCVFRRRRIERMLPLTLCFGTTILLLFSLWQLHVRALSVLVLLAVAGYLMLRLARDRKRLIEQLKEGRAYVCTPGALCWALLALFLLWGCSARQVWFADETNYWATAVRSLWAYGRVVGGDLCLTPRFGNYPPGMAIFQYTVMKSVGGWSDAALYWAQFMACCTLLLPLSERIRWKNAYWMPAYCFGALALPMAVNAFGYAYLGVDVAMGLSFGWALCELSRPQRDRFTSLCVCAALCWTVLMKSSGAALAALALCYAAKAEGSPKGLLKGRRLSLWLPPLALVLIWLGFCSLSGLDSKHFSSVGELLSQAPGGLTPLNALREMLHAMLRQITLPLDGASYAAVVPLPKLLWIVAGVLFPWAWRIVAGADRARARSLTLRNAALALLYCLGLWFAFVALFGAESGIFVRENDEMMARVLERYLCPCVLGLCVSDLAFALRASKARRGLCAALLALLLLATSVQGLSVYLGGPRYAAAFGHENAIVTTREALPWLRSLKATDGRVMIDRRSTPLNENLTRYGATPMRLTFFYGEADAPLDDFVNKLRMEEIEYVVCATEQEPMLQLLRRLMPDARVGVVYELRFDEAGLELIPLGG